MPNLRSSWGPLTIDPLRSFLGANVRDVLAPVLDGESVEREVEGMRVEQLPLAIPEGFGVLFPIRTLCGELGFRNFEGSLVVTVPAITAGVVADALAEQIAAGTAFMNPCQLQTLAGVSTEYGLVVRLGMTLIIPLPVGLIRVEAR